MTENERLRKSLARMVAAFRPFTLRPIGGQGSAVRLEQEEQIAAHAEASALSSHHRDAAMSTSKEAS